ncbi:MAG: AmmeMemoRadiSam system protein B [Candidatus Altiarchaeota archaeon]|nr:AmmeMemoRadiSam system protein B [Candidatus Altiarchaeota archaeon]
MGAKKIRESLIAGSWYPGVKDDLKRAIDGFLGKAEKQYLGSVKALIAPHAGYAYSGQVAAWAYKQVEGRKYRKVIILAPSHHVCFKGASIVEETYMTPLGDVETADDAKKIIAGSDLVNTIPEAEEQEHSLEIQLPFLQRVLGDFKLIPVTVGKLTEPGMEELAQVLMKHLDEDTLLVASTDLSHYYDYDTAVRMDQRAINAIGSLDMEKASECEMCGINPVLVTMSIAKKLGWKPELLKYMNSGDVTGDVTGVVGYAAFAFHVPAEGTK